MRRSIAGLLVVSAWSFGCSSNGNDSDGAAGAPIGFAGFNAGGNGNTAGNGGASATNGGLVPITQAQADAIGNAACTAHQAEAEPGDAQLMLVIDTSSSMNQQARGSNRSKWEVTRDALIEAIVGNATTPGLPANVAVGLLFYPNREAVIGTSPGPTTNCVRTDAAVPMQLLGPAGAAHRTAVANAIGRAGLFRSTPTHDAYKFALENQVLTSRLAGPKNMLLITDGTPTLSLGCQNPSGDQLNAVDPEPIVGEVTRAAASNVRTFLIGSPGSEDNRPWMSRAAVIGGTSPTGCRTQSAPWCHLDMTESTDFSATLRQGLSSVLGSVLPCTFDWDKPPQGETLDRNALNVILRTPTTATLLLRDADGDCANGGYRLTADDRIELCPSTCTDARAAARSSVHVVAGCAPITEPPH